MDTPTAPHPFTPAELAAARRSVGSPPGRARRIRRGAALAAGLLALVLGAAAVDVAPTPTDDQLATVRPSLAPTPSSTSTVERRADRAGRARDLQMADRAADGDALPVGTPPTTGGGAGFDPTWPSQPGVPGAGPPAPLGAPHLEVVPSIVLDDGVYETDVVLRNTGGSALSWNATTEPGDVVAPAQGVIPPGGQAILHVIADEYATGSKEWTHRLVVHSDGGDAAVDLHGTTLLPPQLELVGGTQVNQFGNVFVFPNGAINVGLQLKNEGDLDLHLTRSIGANGKVLGAAEDVIEGGQTKFFPFSLCGVPVPAVATSVDVHVQFDAGAAGAFPAIFRFNLNAGQPTGPC